MIQCTRSFRCLLLLALLFLAFPAAAGTPIQKLDQPGLHRLLTGQTQPMAVVAMAAWCAPCREELPALNRLYTRYRHRGFEMVGLSVDQDGPAAMQAILDRLRIGFPVYWIDQNSAESLDLYGIPTIFLVKNGKIVDRMVGKQPESTLEKKITDLVTP